MCRRFPALRAGRLQGRGAQGGQLGRVRRAGRGGRTLDRVSGWGWSLPWARVAAHGRRLPRVPGACCALRSSRASGCRSGPGEAQVRGGLRVTAACLAFTAAFLPCHGQLQDPRIS